MVIGPAAFPEMGEAVFLAIAKHPTRMGRSKNGMGGFFKRRSRPTPNSAVTLTQRIRYPPILDVSFHIPLIRTYVSYIGCKDSARAINLGRVAPKEFRKPAHPLEQL